MNDAGTYRPVWASCLAAFRPGHDPRPALDQLAALGFGGVRVFAGPLPWTQPATDLGDVYRALPQFLHWTHERGLYVEVTALCETGTGYDKDAHLGDVGDITEDYEHVILELANEWQHPTQRLNLTWLRAQPKFFDCPVAIGAPDADEPSDPARGPQTWGGTGGSYGTAHLDRGRDTWNQVRRVREIEACSAFGRFPVLNNEPIGAAEPGTTGQRRHDPEFFFTLGALNRLFEVGGVFHSQSGLMAEPLGPVQTACAQAFVRGSRIWPGAERLQYLNVGHTGSPVTSARFNDGRNQPGVTRAYSGVSGAQGFMVALGVVGNWRDHVTFGNGWQSRETLGEMPGVIAVRVSR